MGSYGDGRVVMVTPRDPPHAWKKVDAVLSIVDAELGFVGVGVRNKEESKVGPLTGEPDGAMLLDFCAFDWFGLPKQAFYGNVLGIVR